MVGKESIMDSIWLDMYKAAKAVQNERKFRIMLRQVALQQQFILSLGKYTQVFA